MPHTEIKLNAVKLSGNKRHVSLERAFSAHMHQRLLFKFVTLKNVDLPIVGTLSLDTAHYNLMGKTSGFLLFTYL